MKRLPALLIALAAGASCSLQSGVEHSAREICFNVYRTSTKADGGLTAGSFGVEVVTSDGQVLMDNQKVSFSGGGWVYSPLKFWPSEGRLSFLAYAPHDSETEGLSASFGTGGLSLTLERGDTPLPDLLYAMKDEVATLSPRPVTLVFNHILGCTTPSVRFEGAGAATTAALVRLSLTIREPSAATFDGNAWSIDSYRAATHEVSPGGDFLCIPSGEPLEASATLEYTVHVDDPGIEGGVDYSFIKEKGFLLDVNQGRKRTLLFTVDLGSQRIGLDASESSPWDGDSFQIEVPKRVIHFADAEVKRICVENFDTDTDGEISYEEAEAVESFGTVFSGNTLIQTFDECKFFTSVTSLEARAFQGCSSFRLITLPEGLGSIGKEAFQGCSSLGETVLPAGLQTLGSYAFEKCSSMPRAVIPGGVTQIPATCFANCTSLTEVVLPSSVNTLGNTAFYNCRALRSINIPEGVEEIPSWCFRACTSLKTIPLPQSVKILGQAAFEYCLSLEDITLPEGLVSIGERAFQQCPALEGLALPSTLTSIGAYALSMCDRLTGIAVPEAVATIGEGAFQNCHSLTGLTLPSTLGAIPAKMVKNDIELSDIQIPQTVTSIGEEAFYSCFALGGISVPESVLTIGRRAFGDCSRLIELSFYGSAAPDADPSCFGEWEEREDGPYNSWIGRAQECAGLPKRLHLRPGATGYSGGAWDWLSGQCGFSFVYDL